MGRPDCLSHPAASDRYLGMDASALKQQVRLAFDNIEVPPARDLPHDFRLFAGGKHWATVSVAGLFLVRNTLADLSPQVLTAYIGAYMTGGLIDGPYEIDLLRCALAALTPDAEEAFDSAQRAAADAFRDYALHKLDEIGIRNYARPARIKRTTQRAQ